MRLALGIAILILLTGSARASVADYCAAYARDIADQWTPKTAEWQTRYDEADAACNFRYTHDAAPARAKKPKAAIAAVKPKAQPAAKPKPASVIKPKAPPTEKVAKAIPNLVAGSPEWTAYCKKKYVSFDETKGTYQSKSGIERKCLVTAD